MSDQNNPNNVNNPNNPNNSNNSNDPYDQNNSNNNMSHNLPISIQNPLFLNSTVRRNRVRIVYPPVSTAQRSRTFTRPIPPSPSAPLPQAPPPPPVPPSRVLSSRARARAQTRTQAAARPPMSLNIINLENEPTTPDDTPPQTPINPNSLNNINLPSTDNRFQELQSPFPSRQNRVRRTINNQIVNQVENIVNNLENQNESTPYDYEFTQNNEPNFPLNEENNNNTNAIEETNIGATLSETVIDNTVSNIIDNKCNLLTTSFNLNIAQDQHNDKSIFAELNDTIKKNVDEFIRALDSNHEIQEIDKEMFKIYETCDFVDNSQINEEELRNTIKSEIEENIGIPFETLKSSLKIWKSLLKENLDKYFGYEAQLKTKLKNLYQLNMWANNAKKYGIDIKECIRIVNKNLKKFNIIKLREKIIKAKILFNVLKEVNKDVFNIVENRLTCSICFDNDCDIAFIPCGHICCNKCYSKMQRGNRRRLYLNNNVKCHLCRSIINNVQKIYIP